MPDAKKVEVLTIPYVPPLVDLEDLQEGALLSQEQINAIRAKYADKKTPGKVKKKDITDQGVADVKYSVAVINGEMYGIYKGEKRGKHLGKGSFGVVKVAQNLKTGEWVVLKSMQEDEKKIEDEVWFLKKTEQYVGEYLKERGTYRSDYRILMKFAPGVSLESLVKSNKKMSTGRRLEISINVLKAVDELHDKGILHGDITPNNFYANLLTKKATPIDFGLSTVAKKLELRGGKVKLEGESKGRSYSHGDPEQSTRYGSTFDDKCETYSAALTIAELLGLAKRKIIGEDGLYRVKLLNEDDEEFINNTQITDIEVRKAILNYLKILTDTDSKKRISRPSLKEAIQFLTQIKNEYLSVVSLINKVGYVDINEYLSASEADKVKIREALGNHEEVIFVDKEGANQKKYIEIKRELDALGINVHQEVVQYKTGQREETIKEHLKEKAQASDSVDVCSFVKSDGVEEPLQKKVSEEHIEFVRKKLEEEIERLKTKYGENNADYTESKTLLKQSISSIDRLAKDRTLNYDTLSVELERLQAKLLSKSPLKQLFDYYVGYYFVTTSAQKVAEIEKEIKPHVTRRKRV